MYVKYVSTPTKDGDTELRGSVSSCAECMYRCSNFCTVEQRNIRNKGKRPRWCKLRKVTKYKRHVQSNCCYCAFSKYNYPDSTPDECKTCKYQGERKINYYVELPVFEDNV